MNKTDSSGLFDPVSDAILAPVPDIDNDKTDEMFAEIAMFIGGAGAIRHLGKKAIEGIGAFLGFKVIKKTSITISNQYSSKIQKQMKKRGWTDKEINEAAKTKGIPAEGKNGPATRYEHPTTKKSIVVDNETGEIFHVGGEGYKY